MIKMSAALRSDRARQIARTVGPDAVVELRSGAAPIDCAAPDTGTLLAEITLPGDWAEVDGDGRLSVSAAAARGVGDGRASHYRLKSAGRVTHMQGTVRRPDSDPLGDMVIDNTAIAPGQEVRIVEWTMTEGNA